MSTSLSQHDLRQMSEQVDRVVETSGDFSGIWSLLRFGREVRGRLVAAIALIVLSSVSVLISARILGQLVEQLVSGGGSTTQRVLLLGGWFLGLESLSVLTQYLGRLGLAHATTRVALNVRGELFRKLKVLPMSYFDEQPLGRTITRLTSDVEGIEAFFSGTLARLITAIVTIVSVLVAMLLTDFRFGLVVVAASLPSLIFTIALRKPVRHWLRVYKQRSAFLNSRLAEFLNGMPVIKIFGLEDWSIDNFRTAARFHYDSGIKLMHWNSIIRPMSILLSAVPIILILWLGGRSVIEGSMALGMVVAFVRYAERFGSPIRSITQEIQVIQEALASSERLRQMILEPEEGQTLGPDGTHESQISGSVEFRDVWMSYRVDAGPVLKGVSFSVRAGQTVGVVGATGSGKTSTLSLLPRLYPWQKGEILLDGVPLEAWKRDVLRSQLGVVSQDTVIFRGTLHENLVGAVAGDEHVAPERILDACRRSGLAALMSRFPDGLNTKIFDGGENLSMGERQLIAFTRTLINNPRILILDEATANIDEECELLIQEATRDLLRGRTCFIIAHRLSTILACDRILVFDSGMIVEQGSHQELMALQGRYAALVARQLGQGAV
jgi:ABC-type multidrug transport system fused ATPase/permease subunit